MKHHVVGVDVYVKVFLALMVLTGVTVAVSFVNLGVLNTLVAMTIATVKALLVVVFFMHLRQSPRVLWLCAGAGAMWFIVMVALTLSDYRTREWLQNPQPWQQPPAQTAPASPASH